MGLFGPSWDWEELQKKNAIMDDLKKENDRVLNELKNIEYNKSMEERYARQQAKIDALNAYNNSLSKEDHDAIKRIIPEARGIDLDIIRSYIIIGKPFKGLSHGYNRNSDIRTLLIVVFIIIVSFLLLSGWGALNGSDYYKFTFYIIVGIFYIGGYYRILLNIIPAKLLSDKIRQTKCYKEILAKLQKMKLENVEYIGVAPTCIKLIFNDNKSVQIYYSDFDFPNLPYTKWGILLSTLLVDLNLTSDFCLCAYSGVREKWMYLFLLSTDSEAKGRGIKSQWWKNQNKQLFSETELDKSDLVVYGYSIYAKNETLFKSIEAKNEYKMNQEKAKLKEKVERGETW